MTLLSSNTRIMAFVPAAAEDNDLTSNFPSVFPPSCAPHQEFHGLSSVLMRRAMSFSGIERCDDQHQHQYQDSRIDQDEMSDDGSSHLLGEKKRRLNLEQVKALERSFELGNKLEPERKIQLARALGLQPRQIAIWFQNRRARCKTKQLEKDYDILKRQYDKLKADNDALKSQNKTLQSELQLLTLRNKESSTEVTPIMFNLNKENEGSNWNNNGSVDENSTIDVNLGTTTTTTTTPRTSSTNSPLNNHDVFPITTFKIEQNSTVPEEGFCNMFTNVEDQTNFWPLPVQQHFY